MRTMANRTTALLLFFFFLFSSINGNILPKNPEELLKQMETDCFVGGESCSKAGENLAMYVDGIQQIVAMYTKEQEDLQNLQLKGDRLINPLLNMKSDEDVDLFRKDHMNILVEIHQQAEELMRLLPEEERRQWLNLMRKEREWREEPEEEL